MAKKRAPRRFNQVYRKVKIDGYLFDSAIEGVRYKELELLAAAGEISELQVHPKFLLDEPFPVKGQQRLERAWMYTADFQYVERATGETVVEDVKGTVITDAYKKSRRMFLRRYPHLVFIEVRMPATGPVVRLGGTKPTVSGQERLRGVR